MDTAIGCG